MNPIDMEITDYNCEYLGLSRQCLMESAGKSLAEEIAKIAVHTFSCPVTMSLFTGSGGNGGDCFVAARYLINRGYDVNIYMLKDDIHSENAKKNLQILKNLKPNLSRLNIYNLKTSEDIDNCVLAKYLDEENIVVDGILGTGIKGELQPKIKKAIELINKAKGLKISVDVPSGMDPLTGEGSDLAVIPDYTVTFHKIKTGVRKAGEEKVGGLVTTDIGIPFEAEYFINFGDFLKLKNRDSSSHKGNNGRILVVGGSNDYHGAPILSSLAALSSGSDLIYVASPLPAAQVIKASSPNLIVKSLDGEKLSSAHAQEIIKLSQNVDVVLLGPGSGIDKETSKLFNILVSKIKKPLVLDADSLKQVDLSLIKNRDDIILTPHINEFKSFFNVDYDIKLDLDSYDCFDVVRKIDEFQLITNQINGSVVVKGKYDLILTMNKFKINRAGNAGMTVGGTGDVLSGICASLLAQGLNAFDAAYLGVFINGLSGDRAFNEKGYGFTPTDMISHIGKVIKDGLSQRNL